MLWSLVWETAVLLGFSCLAGAAFGVYGQLLLSHALLNVTGFPLLFSARIPLAIGSVALVTAVAGVISRPPATGPAAGAAGRRPARESREGRKGGEGGGGGGGRGGRGGGGEGEGRRGRGRERREGGGGK